MTLLRASGLRKRFGGARALDGVDFELRAGEIHAVAGENGAGKSTLLKILGGALSPDAGELSLGGQPLPAGDPVAVRNLGVSTVHQELTLVPDLTVAENVCLGRERGWPFLRRREMLREVQALLATLGLRVEASRAVRGLSVAQQQLIEIARALAEGPPKRTRAQRAGGRVLILDEPTAALSAAEADRLFALLRTLRGQGVGIVYISHRLEEIFALADRITVLRDGRHIATADARDVSRPQLIRWMVGRDVSEEFPPRSGSPGPLVLDVSRLSSPPRFEDVSLTVRAGEIVGLAGLVGCGRTSTALALTGALESTGQIRLDGAPVRFRSPADAIRQGLAYVTENRKAHGIFPAMATADNITLTYLDRFTRGRLLHMRRLDEAAAVAAQRFDVRGLLRQAAATLSGGNQQKMLLARYLLEPRRLIVLDEPTRGVDVGARAEIYSLMNRLTAEGLAILMISSDLQEVLGMADRIVVLRDGRTAGELAGAEATPEAVMRLATGARPAA